MIGLRNGKRNTRGNVMENLSNEELIENLTAKYYIGVFEAEIMRRFAAYEQTLKEIAALADRMLEGK
jgi:anti-sigma-K factor RskA